MSESGFLWVTALAHLFAFLLYYTAGRCKPVFYYTISTFTATLSFVAAAVLAIKGEPLAIEVFQITHHIGIAFGLDRITLTFALLCSLLSIPATIYAISYMYAINGRRKAVFFARIHLSLAITMLLAFSGNLVTMFIFYELLTLATYTLVNHDNTENSLRAARTYLAYLVLPSVGLLLPAILITYKITGSFTFDASLHISIVGLPRLALFLMFGYGTAKAAIFPLHGWLPRAMVAPTPVSALLHAVAVVKAGVFCMLKVAKYVFTISDPANVVLMTPITCIYAFTIIFASVVALKKHSLKEILAYSTISQLSYIGITLSIFTENAFHYAILYMILHAFAKITLFFTAGAIYARTGRTSIKQLHGIGREMPIAMSSFTVGALTMIGLPPTATLLCKADILSEALAQGNYILIVTLVISTALNCGYFLPIIFNAFFREPIVATSIAKTRTRHTLCDPLALSYLFTGSVCIVLFVYKLF
ncbi:NADH-ubiquinone/plastoquinone oxidoreductase family protein [Neorickettsia risticii str. Illinois]|uniref:NADH-ubiquinone/plastoquinone oxidoreductase family protein n=1 Tax=Neorickettsia risticii (strain Illinois) TaxID=434131 RepID=C6V549_NEORI|nr:proton-conducting transporter membrane subunit [Neorickettsia risticii]ACT69514.1 NADH-ubiquinone/plastoquinone oxidoreductase family protein [Neorickettsia risticii str. Illinois]